MKPAKRVPLESMQSIKQLNTTKTNIVADTGDCYRLKLLIPVRSAGMGPILQQGALDAHTVALASTPVLPQQPHAATALFLVPTSVALAPLPVSSVILAHPHGLLSKHAPNVSQAT